MKTDRDESAGMGRESTSRKVSFNPLKFVSGVIHPSTQNNFLRQFALKCFEMIDADDGHHGPVFSE